MRVFVMLIGAVLLGLAAIGAFQTSRFMAGAAIGDGTVTRLNAGGSHPQIAFQTRDQAVVSYAQGGMIMGFTAGQPVRVFYDPANPAGTARVESFGSLWGSSLLLALLGCVLLALGVAAGGPAFGFYLKGR